MTAEQRWALIQRVEAVKRKILSELNVQLFQQLPFRFRYTATSVNYCGCLAEFAMAMGYGIETETLEGMVVNIEAYADTVIAHYKEGSDAWTN